MPHPMPALDSLDAWPGEAARPPLRMLDTPRRPTRRAEPAAPQRPAGARDGWLQRMRQVLAGR